MTNNYLHIPIDLYFADVFVFFNQESFDIKKISSTVRKGVTMCKDPKESYKHVTEGFKDVYKQYFIDSDYGGVCSSNGNFYMIVVAEFDFLSATFHSDLSHEIRHCVDKILLDCAMTNHWENREAYAYLHGFITKQCYKYLLNTHKKHILTGEK